VTNRLQRVINLINILEFTPAKSHTVAHCVANLLHGGTVWQSTIEKFILMKLMQLKLMPQQEFPVDPEKALANVF
jgi:2-polyprenyl-3-methyl-5-hydroxy-6-metoxy-1,4-benzoquinol methylase